MASAQRPEEWRAAERSIVRLSPDSFPELPAPIRSALIALVGGGEHDWATLLDQWGWLQRDQALGRAVFLLGLVLYGSALVAGWVLLYPRRPPASQGELATGRPRNGAPPREPAPERPDRDRRTTTMSAPDRIPPTPERPFLTAEWRYLAMLQYEVDRQVLRAFVPRGTELDEWRGRALVSLVGFRFLDTRVLGARIPFHRHFER